MLVECRSLTNRFLTFTHPWCCFCAYEGVILRHGLAVVLLRLICFFLSLRFRKMNLDVFVNLIRPSSWLRIWQCIDLRVCKIQFASSSLSPAARAKSRWPGSDCLVTLSVLFVGGCDSCETRECRRGVCQIFFNGLVVKTIGHVIKWSAGSRAS